MRLRGLILGGVVGIALLSTLAYGQLIKAKQIRKGTAGYVLTSTADPDSVAYWAPGSGASPYDSAYASHRTWWWMYSPTDSWSLATLRDTLATLASTQDSLRDAKRSEVTDTLRTKGQNAKTYSQKDSVKVEGRLLVDNNFVMRGWFILNNKNYPGFIAGDNRAAIIMGCKDDNLGFFLGANRDTGMADANWGFWLDNIHRTVLTFRYDGKIYYGIHSAGVTGWKEVYTDVDSPHYFKGGVHMVNGLKVDQMAYFAGNDTGLTATRQYFKGPNSLMKQEMKGDTLYWRNAGNITFVKAGLSLNNFILGNQALHNFFLGLQSGKVSATGADNTGIGQSVGAGFTTEAQNSIVGSGAGALFNSGNHRNTLMGYQIMGDKGYGGNCDNTIFGASAFYNAGNAFTNGSMMRNTIIGSQAGYNTTVTASPDSVVNNIFLGYKAGYSVKGKYHLIVQSDESVVRPLLFGIMSMENAGKGKFSVNGADSASTFCVTMSTDSFWGILWKNNAGITRAGWDTAGRQILCKGSDTTTIGPTSVNTDSVTADSNNLWVGDAQDTVWLNQAAATVIRYTTGSCPDLTNFPNGTIAFCSGYLRFVSQHKMVPMARGDTANAFYYHQEFRDPLDSLLFIIDPRDGKDTAWALYYQPDGGALPARSYLLKSGLMKVWSLICDTGGGSTGGAIKGDSVFGNARQCVNAYCYLPKEYAAKDTFFKCVLPNSGHPDSMIVYQVDGYMIVPSNNSGIPSQDVDTLGVGARYTSGYRDSIKILFTTDAKLIQWTGRKAYRGGDTLYIYTVINGVEGVSENINPKRLNVTIWYYPKGLRPGGGWKGLAMLSPVIGYGLLATALLGAGARAYVAWRRRRRGENEDTFA